MLGLLAYGAAYAAPLTLNESVTTTADPKAVWTIIQDFDGIGKWLPPVASSPADKGNNVGSVRTLTLKGPGNPTIIETLTDYNPTKHTYSYDITQVDPKVLPVVNYHSTIAVHKVKTGGTKVVWKGNFEAAPGTDDKAAKKAVRGVYRAGLDNIKALAEKQ